MQLLPALNIPASVIRTIIAAGRGNFGDAALNMAGIVPGISALRKADKAAETISAGKYLFETWHKSTFENRMQSVVYHMNKHGNGRTAVEYTNYAMRFFSNNRGLGERLILKDSTNGIRIVTKQIVNCKVKRIGGYWTANGKLDTFWD